MDTYVPEQPAKILAAMDGSYSPTLFKTSTTWKELSNKEVIAHADCGVCSDFYFEDTHHNHLLSVSWCRTY